MKTQLYRSVLTSLTILLCAFFVNAQNELDPKHENHYKYVAPILTDEIKIEITNAHSQMYFTQVKIRITNKTNDFIAVKSDELVFHINGTEYRPKDKTYLIGPRDNITRTIRVEGDNRFHVDNFTLELRGFYKIPADGNVKYADNFNLPVSANHFEFDGFQCKVAGRVIQETQLTELPLRCTYVGDDIGLIEGSRISVKLENGMEFANVNTGSKIKNLTTTGSTDVLFPGEDAKITAIFRIPATTADMQFSNLIVNFNDTFSESKLRPISVTSVDFELDEKETQLRN